MTNGTGYSTVKTVLQHRRLQYRQDRTAANDAIPNPNDTNPNTNPIPNPNRNAILNSSNNQTQTARPETELHRQNSIDNYTVRHKKHTKIFLS